MIYYYDGKPTRRRPREFDTVYFDMDGTIADLYKPTDWLERLLRGDETLYKDAAPMCDLRRVEGALRKAHSGLPRVAVERLTRGLDVPSKFGLCNISPLPRKFMLSATGHTSATLPTSPAFC